MYFFCCGGSGGVGDGEDGFGLHDIQADSLISSFLLTPGICLGIFTTGFDLDCKSEFRTILVGTLLNILLGEKSVDSTLLLNLSKIFGIFERSLKF